MNDRILSVRLPVERHEEMALVCKVMGITQSELIRRGIDAEIEGIRHTPAFIDLLRQRIADDQKLLERLTLLPTEDREGK